MDDRQLLAQCAVEFARLGLRLDHCPYDGLATDGGEAAAHFMQRLRALPSPSTWRAVFPDLPAHWDLDDPESWTVPYRPIGTFDYPTLPTGPVVMISWPTAPGDDALRQLHSEARTAGYRIHGAGWVSNSNPAFLRRPARVVLDRTSTDADLHAFTDWIEAHPVARFDGVSRGIAERFAPE